MVLYCQQADGCVLLALCSDRRGETGGRYMAEQAIKIQRRTRQAAE